MNYLEFSQKVKAKYPQYSDMDDRELAEKMVAKFPTEYGDVTFDQTQQAAPQPTTPQQAAFPRTMRAIEQGQPYLKQAMGAGLDLLSGPGRAAASTMAAPMQRPEVHTGPGAKMTFPTSDMDPEQIKQQAMESMAKLEGDGFLESIVRDPATGAVMLTLPITGPMMAAAKTAGPVFAAGAIEGGASVAAHQAENVLAGKGIDPLSATGEMTLSMLPGLASVVGKKALAAAPNILRQSVKPARKFMDKVNKPDFIKPLEKKMISWFGGLEEGVNNVSEAVKVSAEARDNLIKNADLKINITDATRKVGKKLQQMVKNGEIDDADAVMAYRLRPQKLRSAQKMARKYQAPQISDDAGRRLQQSIDDYEADVYGAEMLKQEQLVAKENFQDFAESGHYADIIKKMAKKVQKQGEVINKQTGMPYRETIPREVFGQSSDEIAANVGMDESDFMAMLQEFDYTKKPVGPKLNDAGYPADWDLDLPTKAAPKAEKLVVSGEDAVKIRKLADQNSKFNPFQGPVQNPNTVVFNEAYRRVLEDEIENALMRKAGMVTKTKYKKLKKEMADLIPFQKAGEFRLGQLGNNYSFSLMDLGALGVGGVIGGPGLPMRAATAAGVGGLRRLTGTPGGAAITQSMGKTLDKVRPIAGPASRQAVRSLGRPKQPQEYSPIDEPETKVK